MNTPTIETLRRAYEDQYPPPAEPAPVSFEFMSSQWEEELEYMLSRETRQRDEWLQRMKVYRCAMDKAVNAALGVFHDLSQLGVMLSDDMLATIPDLGDDVINVLRSMGGSR